MALFYIVLFVVIVIIFAAMLLFGTREQTFEQALEEQRNKNSFDLLLTSSTSGKSETSNKKESKKDKIKKVKDVTVKKNKDKSSANQAPKVVTPKEQNVTKFSVPKQVEASSPLLESATSQPDVVDIAPQTSNTKTPIQPKEVKEIPISKKAQPKPRQQQHVEKHDAEKAIPAPKVAEVKATTSPEPVKAPPAKASADISPVPTPLDGKIAEQSKVNNNKKSKKSLSRGSQELSFEDILELVKSSYFSDEDITRLTDALLNRQADEQSNDYSWHKKNDPVEALQKQLLEKNELIDQQNKNMDAMKKQSASVVGEMQAYKKRFNRLETDNENLRRELEQQKNNYGVLIREVEVKSQQKFEQKLNEIKVEERSRSANEINRLQHEVTRLGDIISGQSEGMKDKEHELSILNQKFKEENQELSDKLAELTTQQEKIRQKLDAAEQAREHDTVILNEQIAQLSASKELLEKQIKDNDTSSVDIEAYTSQISSLKADVAQYSNKSEQLDKELASLKSQHSSISSEKDNLNKDLNDLKDQFKELQNENNSLVGKLDSLTSEKNSLSSKSDDLNNLIKTNDEKLETLVSVCNKLGVSCESDNLQKSIDDIKAKLSQYDELNNKYADLNELFEQVNGQNETLKSQIDTLKQQSKEDAEKSQEYATTLLETEKILNDLQEKIIKNKSEQNQKLEEFEQTLAERAEENESTKEELNKTRENVDSLNKQTEALNDQLKSIKELLAEKEDAIASFKSKEADLCNSLEKIQEENKNLNIKIGKLNNMVQIGKHSYQDECQKVQNLESIISLMNGKENSSGLPTSNGNSSSNLPST